MSNSLETIDIAAGMDAPELPTSHRLRAIIATSLKRRGAFADAFNGGSRSFWAPKHFHLDRIKDFTAAASEQQECILSVCSNALLRESYFIEKGGMHYAAKLSLLSRSTEERMLYNLFAAEETQHFHWISGYVTDDLKSDPLGNPFLKLLSEISHQGDRATMMFVLQVVLEGWGLHYYKALAGDCTDPALKRIFETILRDEAGHHGGGLLLFNEETLDDRRIENLVSLLRRFLLMVQVGPQTVVGVLSQVLGYEAADQRHRLFEELRGPQETQTKLAILEGCIRMAKYGDRIADQLKDEGFLHALDAGTCASIEF